MKNPKQVQSKKWNATYYKNNKEERKRLNNVARERNRAFILEVKKEKPCADCGKVYIPCVMEFDHISGNKQNDIARMVADQFSISAIEKEIAKCELVCANCHRIRTYNRRLSHSGRAADF